jgi:hypothetical protein
VDLIAHPTDVFLASTVAHRADVMTAVSARCSADTTVAARLLEQPSTAPRPHGSPALPRAHGRGPAHRGAAPPLLRVAPPAALALPSPPSASGLARTTKGAPGRPVNPVDVARALRAWRRAEQSREGRLSEGRRPERRSRLGRLVAAVLWRLMCSSTRSCLRVRCGSESTRSCSSNHELTRPLEQTSV